MSGDVTDIIKFGYGQNSYKEYKEQARGIFNDDPVKFLLDVAERVHIGDRDATETLLLSLISAHPSLNTRLNIALTGESDVGKTHLCTTCLNMAPPEYIYETTRITPKVLYYQAMGNNDKGIPAYSFYNKTIFLDDITGNDREILKHIANTSSKPPSFTTLINQVPHKIMFDYAPVVWTTRVDLIDDVQVDRRFYSIEIQGSPDVLEHIFNKECNNLAPEETEDWLISKAIMAIVMSAPLMVKIPEFDHSFIHSNSGMKFLIALIRSIAKINASKNEVIAGSVLASECDIIEGVRLYRGNLVQQCKISRKALKILKHVPENNPTDDELDHPEKSPHTVEAIHAEVNDSIDIAVVRKELKTMINRLSQNPYCKNFQ